MKNADKMKLLIELEIIMLTCDICQGKIVFDGNGDLIIDTCTCEDNPIEEYIIENLGL